MEVTATPPAVGAETPEAPRMSFPQRLIGIYTKPSETFEDINRKGSWLSVFLLVAVLTGLMMYLIPQRMGPDIYREKIRDQMDSSSLTSRLSDEQKTQAVEAQLSPGRRYSTLVIVPVFQLITFVIAAALFLLASVLLGGQLNFKKSLAITSWGLAAPGILSVLLGILILFVKDPAALDLDPTGLLVSNLAPLVSRKEHAVQYVLLGSVDVFSAWSIFLLAVGFSIAAGGRLSRGKAAAGVLAVWIIGVAAKVGLTAIFS
jgi:hypothetical protein